MQRIMVCGTVAAIWYVKAWRGRFNQVQDYVALGFTITYVISSLLYRGRGDISSRASVAFLYAYLLLDPVYLIVALTLDPNTFAFLHPLVLVVIVRSGIRYGLRTMYLACGAAIVATSLLLANEFWGTEIEITLSFCLILLSDPLFFSSLIRRVHNVIAIEENVCASRS